MNRLGNEAYELQEKDIEQYLNKTLPELNLRLWADMYGEEIEDIKIADTNMSLIINAILNKNKMLWLESITLTSYIPHDVWRNIQSNAQRNIQKSAADITQTNTSNHNKWRIINRLMGKLALRLSFTLKKTLTTAFWKPTSAKIRWNLNTTAKPIRRAALPTNWA